MIESDARALADDLSTCDGISEVEVLHLSTMLTDSKPWTGFGVRYRKLLPPSGLDTAGAKFGVGSGDILTFRPFTPKPHGVIYIVNGFPMGVVDDTDRTVSLLARIPHSLQGPGKAYFMRTEDSFGQYLHRDWTRAG